MFTFNNYLAATSLDEAYAELLKNKRNLIIGGTSYLRMGNAAYNTAIDLSNLSLSYIRQENEFVHIGAMTSFRDLETSEILNSMFGGIISESVSSILGIQFRSNVTVGATVFSKYGFSDLIPALLAANTTVVLHNAGEIALEEYLKEEKLTRDILVEIKIKAEELKGIFKSLRRSKTDYAVLNMAVTRDLENKFRVAVGARPGKAKLAYKTMNYLNENFAAVSYDTVTTILAEELEFGSNLRASEEYRRGIAKALLIKSLGEVL